MNVQSNSTWERLPIWAFTRRKVEKNRPEEQLLSVYRDWGVVPKASRDDNHNKASEDLSAYQFVEQGDLVLNKMKTWQGSIAVSDHRGIVSPAYYVCSVFGDHDRRFLHHLLRHKGMIEEYRARSKGIRPNQWDLPFDEFRNIKVAIPPLEEQQIIAGYLDRETGRIDALVERLERLIALLTEKRQAVISHAVTKGLNPDAPMKDSGIDWLGEVPAHWEVWKGSHLFTFKSGLAPDGLTLGSDNKYPYIKVGDLNNGPSGSMIDVSAERVTCDPTSLLPAGTIIFPKRGGAIFTNKVRILAKPALVDTNIMGISPSSRISTDILAKIVQFLSLEKLADVSTVPQINNKHIAPIRIPVAPKSEQKAIEQRLIDTDEEFGVLSGSAESALVTLKERRSALISAAVTGQIPLADMTEKDAA
ncbi:restriction endonuclease subunit S [Cognatishimia sp. MH4019]|uniref:restriction endonuclease subunit S n=1 Tax=Cognatishimia sp. MH4019 TaxID=2854030 RepID=UPI001CD7FCAA|nr:restriction endonuclease subunit S [Cognatishimia sp. MH4019]